jgi:hypothetical protein
VDQQQEPRGPPTGSCLLLAGAIFGLSIIAILIGYRYDITLWDWIKLLIVPAVIAGGGFWFNSQQRERELEIAREQREREVEIAERRTQDEALQAYLDQMSDMLIPKTDQPSLYKARPGDSLSSVGRARTLTALPRLDGERKARVVQFLYESGLISRERPVLALSEATLSGANLHEADLHEATLSGANLSGANLSKTNLPGADLFRANLEGSNLRRASLRRAHLIGANLHKVDLRGADLWGAHLRGADLGGAQGITNRTLARQTEVLEGATMPNGQEYED